MNRGAWTDMMFGGGPHVVDDEPEGPAANDQTAGMPCVESQPAGPMNPRTWDVPLVMTRSV